MRNSPTDYKPSLGAFHVSCWVMGLVAFVLLMSVGVALALRGRPGHDEPRVVTEYVMVPRPTPVSVAPPKTAPKIVAMPAAPDDGDLRLPPLAPVPKVVRPQVLDEAPAILDPMVEKLVEEAREARIKGDLVLAQTKLNEAEYRDGGNANVLYDLAVNFDALRVYDKADEYYLRVIGLGPLQGGALYKKAAAKIERGRVAELKGLVSLGMVRVPPAQRVKGGERRMVMLPISVAPGKDFDPQLLRPTVSFFEEVDGKVQPAIIAENGSGRTWVSEPINWKDGEELAEVWYFVPDRDAREAYYSGERKFHGLVVELYYDGRLVDMLAQPRTLFREMQSEPQEEDWPGFDPIIDQLDPKNSNGTLLPPHSPQDLPNWGR